MNGNGPPSVTRRVVCSVSALWLALWVFSLPLAAQDAADPGATADAGATADTHRQVALSDEHRRYLEQLGPITVAPDPDWVPFEVVDAAGNFTGIAADLLDLVAERLGIEFSYQIPVDWPQAVQWSRAGDVLLLPFLNQTPQRDEWLVFTEPLLIEPNVFITRQEHPFIADATQLTDKTIVFPHGTSMEERVRGDFPNLHVITVDSERQVFQAVESGLADLALRSLAIAAYTIRAEGLFNLKIAGQAPEQYTNRLRIGVLKNQPMLRDILNLGIATITPSEREQILNRHINITIVQPFDYTKLIQIGSVLVLLIAVSFYWIIRLRRTNAALAASERSKAVLLATIPGVAYRCKDDINWTMEFNSAACLELTGYTGAELVNNNVVSFNELILPEDRGQVRDAWDVARATGAVAKLEYRIQTRSQGVKWVFEQGVVLRDSHNAVEALEGLIIDISDRKCAEQELYRVSIHDHLTGLFNRRHITERLAAIVLEYRRTQRRFSVCLVDIDHFKAVNDNYGHAAGDAVLKDFAAVLQNGLRGYDLVGRFGGEEFLTVLPQSTAGETAAVLDRLRESLDGRAAVVGSDAIAYTFSGGVAACDELPADTAVERFVDDLVALADRRLYWAKESGRNRIVAQG